MKTPFQITTSDKFSFLEGHGFTLVRDESSSMRYESTKSFVVIDRDYRSGEMNVWFGLRPNDDANEERISLTDLLRMENATSPIAVKPYEVYSEKEIAPFVEEMAKETQTYAGHALEGKPEYFSQLKKFRSEVPWQAKRPKLP